MASRLVLALLCACGSPRIAVYGPRSAHGVTIESMHTRPHTGMWAAGCTLTGTMKNHTDQPQTIELVGDAVVAEGLGEKHRAVKPIRASVTVPPRSRTSYSTEVRVRNCEALMYIDIKSL